MAIDILDLYAMSLIGDLREDLVMLREEMTPAEEPDLCGSADQAVKLLDDVTRRLNARAAGSRAGTTRITGAELMVLQSAVLVLQALAQVAERSCHNDTLQTLH